MGADTFPALDDERFKEAVLEYLGISATGQ
jgi:hypothetical protein